MTLSIKDLTAEELHESVGHTGLTPRQARQIHAAAVRRGTLPAADEGIAAKLLAEVRRLSAIPQLTLVEKPVSPQDGFAKYLFRGHGAEPFEAVRIPLLHRPDDPKYVVCVSSQVGCAMGCAFCATGRMGFRRNLAAWEIVDQVIKIQADSPASGPRRRVHGHGRADAELRPRDPGREDSLRSRAAWPSPARPSRSRPSASCPASGVSPPNGTLYRLVVSLNTADPIRRRQLMPVEKAYPTPELVGGTARVPSRPPAGA